jgi:hypothetical protein
MFGEAFQARLKVVDDEILRLTVLGSGTPNKRQPDYYWDLAHDLQREARELRSEIKRISPCKAAESGAEQSSHSAALILV